MAKKSSGEEFDPGIVYERLEPDASSSFSDPFSAPAVDDPLANIVITREDYGLGAPSSAAAPSPRPLPGSAPSRGAASPPSAGWFSAPSLARPAAAPAAPPRYLPHERRGWWGQAS